MTYCCYSNTRNIHKQFTLKLYIGIYNKLFIVYKFNTFITQRFLASF
jgi:hypothetical protein